MSIASQKIIEPHGGELVQQLIPDFKKSDFNLLHSIEVDDDTASDIVQITEGTYSPVKEFMGIDELEEVLENYKLLNGVPWSLPVIFQLTKKTVSRFPRRGDIAIRCKNNGDCFAVFKIKRIEKIGSLKAVAKKWFNTDNERHPGVKKFLSSGEYLLAGKPLLVKRHFFSDFPQYELNPTQTRKIFSGLGWQDIVGFHTRNVVHRGHEYIQKKALEKVSADGIFISPVVGRKKKGDFKGKIIVRCYEEMIKKGYYNPYGAVIGAFNTYSRYSGPREAVFTAICRKNFGCNFFIIGRDHTGVGNYYEPDASVKIFDRIDIGMNILKFDTVYFCKGCSSHVNSCTHPEEGHISLSGTKVRDALINGLEVDGHLMREDIFSLLRSAYKKDKGSVLE